jgi:hypothetical protein
MFWGCFSWNGLGPIVPIKGSVTGQTHAKVINDYVVPTLDEFFPQGNGIFQEDNASPHRSKIANIVMLDWRSQSPDLNPIENLWQQLKTALEKRIPRVETKADLLLALQEEWANLREKNVLGTLIESMPKRVRLVIGSNGMPIKY